MVDYEVVALTNNVT